ncbi:MAG: TonB C-terminal domain-containing protein [Betaproteobacteria bacterium]|nr:TonB C-terminal domain-containing protein [Betaproteobacteria bacterium]
MNEAPAPAASGRTAPKFLAGVLAVLVHVALVVFLIFGVDWQNRPPTPVSAELYAPPAAKEAPPPPEPMRPPPQPDPVKPPPQPAKAEIALKEKQEKERLRKEQELRDQEKRQRELEKKKLEEQKQAKVREAQAREADALKQQEERARQAALQAAQAARAKAFADYIQRISAKIRGNLILPPDIPGNPEALFEVVQLPTGEIIQAELKKSSGHRPYDDAVQRAILKSSPLPRAEPAELFQRALTLKFRPRE